MNYPIKASLLTAVALAALGVAALYALQLLLQPLGGDGGTGMYHRIVWGNYISPFIIGIFLTAMFLLMNKRIRLSKEKQRSKAFLRNIAPRLLDVDTDIHQVTNNHGQFTDNLFAHRWQETQGTSDDLSNNLKYAELEMEHLQNSYSLPRFFVWALPIVGFVGTVWGIGLSISFFSDTMSASQAGSSVSSLLQQNIPLVTKGLSTAFDTTLLALVLSLPATAFLVITERDEREYLLELEQEWNRFMSSRYDPRQEIDEPRARYQAAGETLRDAREQAYDDRYQQGLRG